LQRRWSSGDTITVVYCLEQLDQPDGVLILDVSLDVRLEVSSKFHEEFHNDMLGEIVVLKHPGAMSEKSASHGALYRRYTPDAPKTRQVKLKSVPYYAWANRAATPIKVGCRSARCRKPG
jgi:DUF1680 family protein